jgi:hypothetical protein
MHVLGFCLKKELIRGRKEEGGRREEDKGRSD